MGAEAATAPTLSSFKVLVIGEPKLVEAEEGETGENGDRLFKVHGEIDFSKDDAAELVRRRLVAGVFRDDVQVQLSFRLGAENIKNINLLLTFGTCEKYILVVTYSSLRDYL